MPRDVAVKNPSTVMADDEQAVEDTEGDRGHGEEIHGRDGFSVVLQESQPVHGRFRISRCTAHPAGNRSLRDIEAQHQEFAMDAWRAPGRILRDHAEDQIPQMVARSILVGYEFDRAMPLADTLQRQPVPHILWQVH
jgi:hypothetical protein